MPRVTVDWLEGRSEEQRNQLAKDITAAFVKNVFVKPEAVTIVFNQHDPAFQYKAGEQYKPVK